MTSSPLIVRQGAGEILNVLGVALRFLCRAEDTRGAWSLMENVIPENAGPPPHHHPWDEAYYVISGEVEFEIDGRRECVGAGDFVYAPAGATHAFHGVSKDPARMLIFDAPAHAETFFKDVDREVSELPRDLEKLPQIGKRHGLVFELA
ncbi:MAG: cupin domain-containing protein [Methylocystis sp.]|uniref:cupin domain-containing protein n=1 Tax=Methylocystis sp. TaxID=1911079 RepID=UPI003DA5B42E